MFDSEIYCQFEPIEVTVRIEPRQASSTGRHIYITQVNGRFSSEDLLLARQYILDIIQLAEKPIRFAAVEEWKQEQARMQEAELRAKEAAKRAARERLEAALYRIPTKTTCLVEHDGEETLCGDSFDMWDHLPNLKRLGTVGDARFDLPICQVCARALETIRKEAE